MANRYVMSEAHEQVSEAVERLRHVLREHERSGERDTPFHLGIREVLEERDGYRADTESAA
jgi:hypothetical protein